MTASSPPSACSNACAPRPEASKAHTQDLYRRADKLLRELENPEHTGRSRRSSRRNWPNERFTLRQRIMLIREYPDCRQR